MSDDSQPFFNRFSIKYQFCYPDIFLIAEVDKNSGKQWLIMQKIDPRTNRVLIEDRIQCIHTAITTLEVEDFEERVSDENFEEDMLNLRSSERAQEIHLEPQEKFFAFKSWVAGIAEAGVNAITIQQDIEQFAHLYTPIANRLFNFLLRAKIDFIQSFLAQMMRDCMFEGEYHKPSIHANLFKLLDIMILGEKEAWNIWRDQIEMNYEWHERWNYYLVKNFEELMEAIYELQPSAQIFLEKEKYHFILTMPESKKLSDYDKTVQGSVVYNDTFIFCYTNEETGLIAIDLYAKKLTSLSQLHGLERITHVQELHLENNGIEKIEGFEIFTDLRQLHINYNSISVIEGLEQLKNLEVLFIGYNKIEKIEGLEKLTNLKKLYLYSNQISRIEGLETLTTLQILNLAWNQILKIEGLEPLTKLIELNLGGNQITHVEGLETLKDLEELTLFCNQLTDEPDFSYLPHLKLIELDDNPFNKK